MSRSCGGWHSARRRCAPSCSLKEQQLALSREVLVRQQRSHDEGLISWIELSKPALEVDRLAVEVEQTRAEIAEAASADARLRYEMAFRKAAFDELARSVEEELARARTRKGMLDREGGATATP